MLNDFEQDDAMKRLEEAIALAESIVNAEKPEQNNTQSYADDDDGNSQNRGQVRNDNAPVGHISKILWKLALVLSLAVFVLCAFRIVVYAITHDRSMRANMKLREYVDYGHVNTRSEVATETATVIKEPDYPVLDVDFQSLKSVNKDICAWIYIPGTDVDYPVLKGTDNSYYLSHDAYGEYSPDGAIFVDAGNDTDFQDFDTVIYGHNMSSGTMFKTLHNYEDESFWKKNRSVYVYMPDAVMCYSVFAAYRTNDRHIFTYNDFGDNEVRRMYIKNIFDKNFDTGIVKNDETVDVDSKLLTLSTCCGMDGKRWLVQAVRTEEIPVR